MNCARRSSILRVGSECISKALKLGIHNGGLSPTAGYNGLSRFHKTQSLVLELLSLTCPVGMESKSHRKRRDSCERSAADDEAYYVPINF